MTTSRFSHRIAKMPKKWHATVAQSATRGVFGLRYRRKPCKRQPRQKNNSKRKNILDNELNRLRNKVYECGRIPCKKVIYTTCTQRRLEFWIIYDLLRKHRDSKVVLLKIAAGVNQHNYYYFEKCVLLLLLTFFATFEMNCKFIDVPVINHRLHHYSILVSNHVHKSM